MAVAGFVFKVLENYTGRSREQKAEEQLSIRELAAETCCTEVEI
jgi:hypothetical protein